MRGTLFTYAGVELGVVTSARVTAQRSVEDAGGGVRWVETSIEIVAGATPPEDSPE